MRYLLICFLLLIPLIAPAQSTIDFDRWFENRTLRIDYHHTGDARDEFMTLDRMYLQGEWAGSVNHLIDNFNNGRYYVKVYDLTSNQLLYSRGFDSYFGEYKTSGPALKGTRKTFHESALIPYPKNKFRFVIEARDRMNQLHELFLQEIDPADVRIIREPLGESVKVFTIQKKGSPHNHVDLAFIAEGYTAGEADLFRSDIENLTEVLFRQEPYKSNQEKFNICGVLKPSDQSGIDEPRHDSYKNTAVNATFNSMGSARYVLTEDNRSLRDIAAHAPYDALVIVVNHERYGGGGIYNFFCTTIAHNQWKDYLFLHEFGHSFAGLGDEYYSSSTAYNEFYARGVEPTEPNITALLNPETLKWKHLLSENIELPTPWEKADFDSMDAAYQKIRAEINDKVARLKREHSSKGAIRDAEEESARLSREHAKKMDNYLAGSRYVGKLGAFEGAGYSSQGLYRPMLDCIMFSKGSKPYCKVCEEAVIKVINHFAE